MGLDEATLDAVRAHMKAVRTPGHYDKVYKDECMFSFDTPLSLGGLFINLVTWQAFGEGYVALDVERTGGGLYLWEKWHKVPLTAEQKAECKARPDKMAIGGEGGFQVDKEEFNIEKEHALVVLPSQLRILLPEPDLPTIVLNAINAIQEHDSASKQEEVAVWEDERVESKYARALEQLSPERTVPSDPSQWRCEETGVTENLWLNLSTGFIGSGRAQWDGSGGNGAALRHFEATGKRYPLVVKLGTITPHGADVYSYAEDENDMVSDTLLAEHLAHWGINMMQMQKTEKSMAELEIDQNMKFEWDQITESGHALTPLSGPGYVGLKNLGNSCYMNSVLQVLWTLPQVQRRYAAPAPAIFRSAPPDAAADFPTQMAKVGVALMEGRSSSASDEAAGSHVEATANGASSNHKEAQISVKPQFFKSVVGRGHPEFSSKQQQDASEFFEYLLELMTRAERAAGARLAADSSDAAAAPPTADAFKYEHEDRIQCAESHAVSYRRTVGNVWSLPIPLDAATNKEELQDYREREAKRQKLREEQATAYIQAPATADPSQPSVIATDAKEDPVKPQVPLAACIERWAAGEEMGDYYSAALARKTTALKHTRFSSFPPYLMLQLKRYYVASDWTARKLDVLVDMPEQLSLEHLRSTGPQPGEQLQPEDPTSVAAAAPAVNPRAANHSQPAPLLPDPGVVAQLMSMGFSENGSKRAAVATQNAGAEVSMEWVFAHMEDADFNDPLPEPSTTPASIVRGGGEDVVASAESLSALIAMGFTDQQATVALQACSGSVERAADWLFSHMDDLDAAMAAVMSEAPAAASTGATLAGVKLDDGPGRYSLVGFISHMGANTACGHYVAHIRKEGRWVIYNDEKVAVSEQPPLQLGYLYLYKRDDTT